MVEILQLKCTSLRENQVTMTSCTRWTYLELKIEGTMINWMRVRRLKKTILGLMMVDIKCWCHGSRKIFIKYRFANVCEKIDRDEKSNQDYEKITDKQLELGVTETAPELPTGERIYYSDWPKV